MIDLAIGHPSTRLLATKELAKATSTIYRDLMTNDQEYDEADRHPLQYGTDNGPKCVREIFAAWFTSQYNLSRSIDPDLLAITCGASAGLGNTCLQMTDPAYTRRIFIMTPAYFLAAKVFQDAGYADKMVGIDERESGFDESQLRRVLELDEASDEWPSKAVLSGKRYKYLFYAVPTFSNPSGITWTMESRRALLDLARQYDILIITDEVYDFLDYSDTPKVPTRRIVDLDVATLSESPTTGEWGNTISNMSFSKYLGPGLRIGTIQGATRRLVDQWVSGGANHSGGAMAQHTSYYVAELIRSQAMETILNRLRAVFGNRAKGILNALAQGLPAGCRVHGGAGGYFIWVELPDTMSCSAETILEAARTKYGVHALAGSACEVPGPDNKRGWGGRCFRISLSKLEEDDAIKGVRLLSRAIADFAQ